MDKTWMSKDRLSHEYKVGVESFMNFALQNATNPDAMPCPCVKCGNLMRKKAKLVRLHMLSNGMDLTYHTWLWHGERTKPSHHMNPSDQLEEDKENFIFEDPIEMVHDAYDETHNPSEFIKLLEDAEKPLYPECVKFSKLSAIVKLYNLKAKYSWSDKSFSDLLILLGDMLPPPNELPLSMYDAKKTLGSLGMEYEKIPACPNDCILYRNIYEKHNSCPTCGASRWKESRIATSKKRIPAKVLWYFSPIPRFHRMFRNKEISKDLTWHYDKRVKDGYMRHPADSPSWKVVDHKWPNFASEPRNLRLGLSADGINPHSLMNSKYSVWPVLLVTYNLPPWLCMKRKFIMLTLLISGPNQPGNDIDVYLAPLVDGCIHLAVHLVREVKLCGPIWYRWMYPFERYMRVLKSYVRNRNRPEGCIAESYIAEEAVEFCSDYLSNVQTCGIPATQHERITKPLSSAIVHSITNEELAQAHRHVLANDVEIDPFIEEHMIHLKKIPANKAKSAKMLQDQHNRLFSGWLRDRVANQNKQPNSKISERLKWMADGPINNVLKYQSYMIDGVTFYTKELDKTRTVQNSGVSLVATTMQVSSAKDKNPVVSDMAFYGVIQEIWELDYRKFRIPMFKCYWVESKGGVKIDDLGFTLVKLDRLGFKNDSFILANQAKQVFYIKDIVYDQWSVVLTTPSREYFEYMDDGQFDEPVIHHHCFSNDDIPNVDNDVDNDSSSEEDEIEQSCVRENCDGIWID